MKFKYHGAYKGFYLLEGEKFKKPFKRLDEEKTNQKLLKSNIKIVFNEKKILKIEEKFVVYKDKTVKSKSENKKSIKEVKKVENGNENYNLKLKIFKKYNSSIPESVLETLYTNVKNNVENYTHYFDLVLETIVNIIHSDDLFSSKVRKIFYYNEKDLKKSLERYNLTNIEMNSLKREVQLDYPKQYISKLPIYYKEEELLFVFYFILVVELLSIIK